jgi:hypothetical protein
MKYKLAVLLGVLLCAGAMAPTPTQAIGFSIEVGDRPHYRHGPWYWHNGARWYWVPGHWAWRHHQKVWIHGHYAPR